MSSNLPPGCTDGDIERAAGNCPGECERCGKMVKVMCDELDEKGRCEDCVKELESLDQEMLDQNEKNL